jgi:hypothetical protein
LFGRRVFTLALVFLLTPLPAPARSDILGVVTQASDAFLGTGPVSVGASIYDGDRLSTDADGAVTLRGGGAMLYLARQSLHSLEGHSNGTQASLSAGTVVFLASHLSAFELLADSAHIRGGGHHNCRAGRGYRSEDAIHLRASGRAVVLVRA